MLHLELARSGPGGMNMRNRSVKILIAMGLAALPLPLLAHQQFSSEFDANKPVTLTGTVTSVDWSDPHVNVFMDVAGVNGRTENWKLEGASNKTLERNGWTRTMI